MPKKTHRGHRGGFFSLEEQLKRACDRLAKGTGEIKSSLKRIEELENLIEKNKVNAAQQTANVTPPDGGWVVVGYPSP